MKFIASIIILIAILASPFSALAQEPGIIMAQPTIPIGSEINEAVISLLTSARPAETYLYAITYTSIYGNGWIASVVGLDNIEPPYTEWSLEDGDAVWLGSIIIPDQGDPTYFDPAALAVNTAHTAKLLPGAGGGAQIYMPFAQGKQMMYGLRGVHGSGDYGTSGMLAVDLVGATNVGASIAPDDVYASAAGVIDYVCTDGISVAVRTYNSTTEDTFLYAHLVDNANLTIGYSIARGQMFATLVHGSFQDTCGWASQSPESYHLHWMFEPSDDYFQAEGYILDTTTGIWKQGTTSIGPLNYLTASGGNSTYIIDEDDPTGLPVLDVSVIDPSKITLRGGHIWDNMIMGMFSFLGGIASGFPESNSALGGGDAPKNVAGGIGPTFQNIISLVIRYTNLFYGGLMLVGPFLWTAGIVMSSEVAYFIYAMIRFFAKLKQAVPLLG